LNTFKRQDLPYETNQLKRYCSGVRTNNVTCCGYEPSIDELKPARPDTTDSWPQEEWPRSTLRSFSPCALSSPKQEPSVSLWSSKHVVP